jgi:S1-C subfamily serine protease
MVLKCRTLTLAIGLAMIGLCRAQAPDSAASPRATSTAPNPRSPKTEAAKPLRLILRAALVDKELNVKPVPQFTLRIYRMDEPSSAAELQTRLDGTVEVDVPAGNYRVESVRPLAYRGKSYSWRVDVSVSRDGQSCELTNDNAIVTSAPETVGGPLDRSRDNLTEFYQKYRDSVVTVWSEIGQGTGFVFNENGLILTNQHVLGASEYVAVQFDDKRKVRAKVIASDAERDVAVLVANLDAFSGSAIAAPLWKVKGNDVPVVEGERVLAIGSPTSHRKIMTTGIVSKIEDRAIIADLNINHGSSGGPLFNSIGQVVGITTFAAQGENSGSTIAGIIRIEEAYPVIAQAQAILPTVPPPSKALLPVEPTDVYPVKALKQALNAKKKSDSRRYFFVVGDFNVGIITPPLKYRLELGGNVAAASNQSKRLKKADADLHAPNPLDDLRNWGEYVGGYSAVINIHARSRLHEKFWSAFSRAMAASGGHPTGPAQLKFKGDFQRMNLLCDNKEIEPIQPGKVAYSYNVSNRIVQVTDASYAGIYTYSADAISPSCKTMALEIESAEKPDKPKRIELNRKLVQQVWDEFAPYRNRPDRAAGAVSADRAAVLSVATAGGTSPALTAIAPVPALTDPGQVTAAPESNNVLVDVRFVSNPTGAVVSFAGALFARTPFVTKLGPGKYPVEMRLDGYATWAGDVTVEAGKPSTVVAEMAH